MKEPIYTVSRDYRKEIADDKYYYARSCIRQNFFPGSEVTFLRVLKENLGRDIWDDPHHTTCTGIGYHSDVVPFNTIQTVIARQFALMSENGYENFVASCVTSFGMYIEITETWKHHPEQLEQIREFLRKATGREFMIPKNIAHTSDIVYKFRMRIAEQMKYPLVNRRTGQPLKIVDHIGCHYAKMFPDKGEGGAEFTQVLQGMIKAWGGATVDYPERRHCCGFGFRQYLVQANRGYSVSNSKKKFESMQPYEPDAILTNCPGCAMFLDRWQFVISEMHGIRYGKDNTTIPVFTYEEMAGLVLGYDPWDLGLQMHQVDPRPFLDKIGIPYDNDRMYKTKTGKMIGEYTPQQTR
ncbi:MAG: heterodisulfide reductase-related iron-sulfur binding cluster [Bacteroidales bacterium]|nr:heterodisulfide reductase-related iron-sulfur binding cluster [Bacteroidales bacterium]